MFANFLIGDDSKEDKGLIIIPTGFSEIDFPDDNLPSVERIELGKRLFFWHSDE